MWVYHTYPMVTPNFHAKLRFLHKLNGAYAEWQTKQERHHTTDFVNVYVYLFTRSNLCGVSSLSATRKEHSTLYQKSIVMTSITTLSKTQP